MPEDNGQEASSIWQVGHDSADRIRRLTISSGITTKKGEFDGALATLQWATSPDGDWRTIFDHREEANTDRWRRDARRRKLKLNEPVDAVYLRMTFRRPIAA